MVCATFWELNPKAGEIQQGWLALQTLNRNHHPGKPQGHLQDVPRPAGDGSMAPVQLWVATCQVTVLLIPLRRARSQSSGQPPLAPLSFWDPVGHTAVEQTKQLDFTTLGMLEEKKDLSRILRRYKI